MTHALRPSSIDISVETVTDQITALREANELIVAADELLHDQIALAQKAIRKNARQTAKNEREIAKLLDKRRIFQRAAAEIREVDAS